MNRNILKDYAPKARRAFIQAVTDKAAFYGITGKSVLPCEVRGDFAIINGRAFPRIVDAQRKELLQWINGHSFSYVMEEIAYTWFNRFAAIRFMEVNGYLSHGYRVLSHPEGHNIPEIVEKAQFIGEMPGLDKNAVIRLKMAGDKDDELYRRLLIAQCNELSSAMPFLFEKVDDPTELLLPDNLLHTGSIIRDMVEKIPEEDWREVEIIGWLYQFYISEKKDALIKAKKAYKSEDIPAVTQLFTPNWIVKYLIQNSLGAKWLRTYPTSSIKSKMEYYIEPAEQTPEVIEELRRITPSSLNPEELTVMDPACGSGHILVEAYNLLKEIYLERGYRRSDIPQLILEKNLFGLEIDDRAAQLAGFALMMRARRDDSGIFERDVQPNIMVIKGAEDQKFSGEEGIDDLAKAFENAETFGSLIRIPEELLPDLPGIKRDVQELKGRDLFARVDAELLKRLIRQTELLSRRYDVVVTNPPYMISRKMNPYLKRFATDKYPDTKPDLFAMFIERVLEFTIGDGWIGLMTPFTWMFLSSYEKLRGRILGENALANLVRPEYHAFFDSAYVPVCGFTILKKVLPSFRGVFIDLKDFYGAELQPIKVIEAIENPDCGWLYIAKLDGFKKIPGSPIAYWVGERIRNLFSIPNIYSISLSSGLNLTGDNDKYLRFFWELSSTDVGIGKKWFFYAKGGGFRRWAGNIENVIDWSDEARLHYRKSSNCRIIEESFWYKEGITWGFVTSSKPSFRLLPKNSTFDITGATVFFDGDEYIRPLLCLLNSKLALLLLEILNPTLSSQIRDIKNIPVLCTGFLDELARIADFCLLLSNEDWDSSETSWGFSEFPLLKTREDQNRNLCIDNTGSSHLNLYLSYDIYHTQSQQITSKMKELEEENNSIFIEAYGLHDELSSDVPIEDITLFANPKYRYKGDLSDDELEARFKEDTMRELISYSVGCMMGRYSLDEPGLIYAHSGNIGFDASRYKTFPADADGIIPITDAEWFDDDAAFRFFRFIEIAWAKEGLEDNLDFVADAIGRRARESSRDTIRRYFVNDFFRDHLKTYKKRPIYWLFSSGKQRAFQALVYLHRYNEGTLSRMRTEYVLPLQSMISRHIENLGRDREAASSTSTANRIQREIDKLRKQREELLRFDEKLRHYADMRIKLDLDDGVKVNYGRFGDLLAEVGTVTGSSE